MRKEVQHHHCRHFVWCFYMVSLSVIAPVIASIDLITTTTFVTEDQALVSPQEIFELGFFSPGRSNWYIGIWYKNLGVQKTVVWVANRDAPLGNSSGTLKISSDGGLDLVEDTGRSVWHRPENRSSAGNVVAELLDSGNFVLRLGNDENPENYIWQSFDYPTDTLLAGMKLGWDSKSGLNRHIHSWKSMDDPSFGDYTFQLNKTGVPEIYLYNKHAISYRSGPWNGVGFSGVPEMKPSPIVDFMFKMEPDEVYYSFDLNKTVRSRMLVSYSGSLQRFNWIPSSNSWNSYLYAKDQCDNYRECGAFGICDANAEPINCRCMKGFEPKNPVAWNLRDGSDGCVRVSTLDCDKDGFMMMNNTKLPESRLAIRDPKMTLAQCKELCKTNCSCQGFANSNITNGGSGCLIWLDYLYDVRVYPPAVGGQVFYLRVAASDLDPLVQSKTENGSGKGKRTVMIIGIAVGVGFLLSLIGLCILVSCKRGKSKISQGNVLELRVPRSHAFLLNAQTILTKRDQLNEASPDEIELPLLGFITIAAATNKFSESNKLGQGGFGSVYKGMLPEGQEIAVKRLSKSSGQGVEEFKNEVKLIARLQHRNLVRLLGCCIEMEEKMLIYEYMENKRLDSILFKKDKSSILDWPTRFNIICGVARGLLYLHQDSRFRIIHRDLKTSNILLDKDMNPKISDFGMARIFGGDQTEGNTRKVVGTYGYMSPEYAMDGLFSVKSDVFSFGVLVLEIVSGKKNRGFYQTNNQLNLLAYAWGLYRETRGMELMDLAIGETHTESEVLRCMQVGLLCVQENAEDRPNMSHAVMMLSSEYASMPQPKNPGFCLGRRPIETDTFSGKQDESCTMNHVTVTMVDGR